MPKFKFPLLGRGCSTARPSHHPKGVPPQPVRHHLKLLPDQHQTALHQHREGPGRGKVGSTRLRPDCKGGWLVGVGGAPREGEGIQGGVGRVSLGGALPLPHSHHGRLPQLLSLTFCSPNAHPHCVLPLFCCSALSVTTRHCDGMTCISNFQKCPRRNVHELNVL